ncbi:AF9 [Hepatospora eriocheir]|uniref:Protein AF-9 homolog n=1 Tax=Hepatospora eriocheir TaxID=1081669 RepID=A0A1X0QES2_9MICR|nr:AF9 [Hepatospora eriocheir]
MNSQTNFKIPAGYKTAVINYGSIATMLTPEEKINEITHKWEVYVNAPEGFIKSVTYRLHETFVNPVVTITKKPFMIQQLGWGEFTIQIKVTLFNNDKLHFLHFLKLHGPTNVVKSDKIDTVFYRGQFNFPDQQEIFDDSDEFYRIEKAIDKTIEELERLEEQ